MPNVALPMIWRRRSYSFGVARWRPDVAVGFAAAGVLNGAERIIGVVGPEFILGFEGAGNNRRCPRLGELRHDGWWKRFFAATSHCDGGRAYARRIRSLFLPTATGLPLGRRHYSTRLHSTRDLCS